MNFKKSKVILLPTNQKVINTKEYQLLLSNSLFWTSKIEIERYTEGWFFLNNSSNPNSCAITVPNVENLKHQHLYIISDDKIEEGDYYIIDGIPELLKNNGLKFIDDYCKKVIATTDTSLLIDTYINQGDTVKGDLIIKRGSDYTTGLKGRINLPQPSKQFIQKFVEEYNKGNVITDVLVEYEEIIYNPEKEREYQSNDRIYIEDCDKQTRLKINYNDNTITVKKVKNNWNCEEQIDVIEKYLLTKEIDVYRRTKRSDIKKWVEENL